MDIIYVADMDDSYGTYVDDEYFDNHDYDDVTGDNDHKNGSYTAAGAAPGAGAAPLLLRVFRLCLPLLLRFLLLCLPLLLRVFSDQNAGVSHVFQIKWCGNSLPAQAQDLHWNPKKPPGALQPPRCLGNDVPRKVFHAFQPF